jgi:hypothetical protein
MPRANIIAADRSLTAVEAAIDAGADVGVHCDVTEFRKPPGSSPFASLPEQIAQFAPYDIINLDFCGPVAGMEGALRKYSRAAAKAKGILMATFSYGRDVRELYDDEAFGDVPRPLAARVRACAVAAMDKMHLCSVLAYSGNQMPMYALLWEMGGKWEKRTCGHTYTNFCTSSCSVLRPPLSFARVGAADLYAAATMFDRLEPSELYALPPERVLHFRRKFAAEKAVATRRSRRAAKLSSGSPPLTGRPDEMDPKRRLELLRRVRRFPPPRRPEPGERLKLSKNFRLQSRVCTCCNTERFFITRKKKLLSMGHDWTIFHNHYWGEQ